MAHSMILYDNDEVEAIFHNGKSVKLSPCGANVILPVETAPNFHPVSQPKQLHQWTKFVTHQYRSQVQTTLDFRNRFGENVYLCRELLESENIMEYYANIKVVDWPTSVTAVVINPDGSMQLTSLDECATITLAPNKQEFSVLFLCKLNSEQENIQKTQPRQNKSNSVSSRKLERNVLSKTAFKDISYKLNFNIEENDKSAVNETIKKSTNVSDDTSFGSELLERSENLIHHYVWQVQNHPVAECPETWRCPLRLLVDAAKILQESPEKNSVVIPEEKKNEMGGCSNIQENRSLLPVCLPEKCPRSHLHKMCLEEKWGQQIITSDDTDDVRVWMYRKRIKVLYSRGIIYRVLWHPEPSLEIYPGNGSVLKSMPGEGVYFTYFSVKDGKLHEQILSINTPPPANIRCGSHTLASLLKRGNRLLSQMKLIDRNTVCQSERVCWKDRHGSPLLLHNSLQLVEECTIEGTGHFAAFSNGYLRIKFRDRTIVELQVGLRENQSGACSGQQKSKRRHRLFPDNVCRILHPNGKENLIDLKSSQDANGYTEIATQWATWVSLSTEQRLSSYRNTLFDVDKIREVGLELERLQKFNSNASSQERSQETNQPSQLDVEFSGATIRNILERNSAKIQDIEDTLKDS